MRAPSQNASNLGWARGYPALPEGGCAIIKEWFAVSPAAARVVVTLYEAGGKAVAIEDLAAAVGQTVKGLRASLVELRASMDKGSVSCARSVGYRLTPVGRADVEAACADYLRRAAA
ncbi:hypothetical protein LJR164_001608 [Phenylobacterium sp. LjRoot164]|uniref:hypothetical protein n=1 Tax=unclassified Phenylobacterium TaxID=2640670 RepID=UPI003ED15D6C